MGTAYAFVKKKLFQTRLQTTTTISGGCCAWYRPPPDYLQDVHINSALCNYSNQIKCPGIGNLTNLHHTVSFINGLIKGYY